MIFRPILSRNSRISCVTVLKLRPVWLSLGAAFLCFLNTAIGQTASSVTLAWTRSTSSSVTGYRVFYGGVSKTYTNKIDVGNATNATITGLRSGSTYYFAAASYTADGMQSPYSSEITYAPTAASAPGVVLTSPANGASYTAPATVTFAATVSTNGHTINKVQFFNGSTLLGEDATPPYSFAWTGVGSGTYSVSAKLVYDTTNSLVSATSKVTVNPQSIQALTFASTSGTITAPFVANNGLVSQPSETTVTTGGRAAYTVNIPATGNYQLSAMVIAPHSGANSFYLNFDSEPTDPTMIWDVPITTTLASEPVSWRGTGTDVTDQFSPKIFSLTQGTHQLIIRGREANTQLGTITITPVGTSNTPPAIALTSPANGSSFTAPASISLAATTTPNGHTITKVQFFNGTSLLAEATNAPYSYSWRNVSAGTYTLLAKAVYDGGSVIVSSTSSVVVTNPAAVPLPAPWQTLDVGSAAIPGNASVSNGVYFVTGAGVFNRASDSFRFAYQPMSGDGDIRIRINALQGTNTAARAGIMIRESLTTSSTYAFAGISPNGTVRWQTRRTTGGRSSTVNAGTGALPNLWVRLTRSGSTITAYSSTDGANWSQLGSTSITMATNVYFGIGVASGQVDALASGVFSSPTLVP
ncbi:MAG TPA: Ig-like domain-containing protein [Verrucomicrobiae bacterium]|nr:Ig-like domain-containing protein [Verrucomicrobiae bacterium]